MRTARSYLMNTFHRLCYSSGGYKLRKLADKSPIVLRKTHNSQINEIVKRQNQRLEQQTKDHKEVLAAAEAIVNDAGLHEIDYRYAGLDTFEIRYRFCVRDFYTGCGTPYLEALGQMVATRIYKEITTSKFRKMAAQNGQTY